MKWAAFLTVLTSATIKFMFAPALGRLTLSFWETYAATVSGGLISAVIFYFSSDFFMHRAAKKRADQRKEALEKGIPYKEKRKFTRINRTLMKVKRSIGIYGISFWAPLFLSVPLGCIITAKFYGYDKRTFPLIVTGIFMNALITTSIAYIF